MKHIAILVTAICLCTIRTGAANDLTPVVPIINNQTYIVATANLQQMDAKAIFDNLNGFLNKSNGDSILPGDAAENLSRVREGVSAWLDQFKQAGGTRVYALAYASDGISLALAFPMQKSAKIDSLKQIISPLVQNLPIGPMESVIKDDLLLFAPKANLQKLLDSKPGARGDILSAFESVAGFQLQWIFAPTDDQRRVIQDMVPTLKLNQKDYSSSTLSKGFQWGASGQNIAPTMSLSVIIQSADQSTAQDLRNLLDALTDHWLKQEEFKSAAPLLKPLIAMILPRVEKDRLVASIQDPPMSQMLENLLRPALLEQKTKATRIMTMNNVKQIILACIMYNNDKKKWPEKLTELGSYLGNLKILQSPRHPEQPVGFEYLIPGKNSDKYPTTEHLLLYETFTSWPVDGLTLGFLDGHSEITRNRERFEKLLNETKARNAGQ